MPETGSEVPSPPPKGGRRHRGSKKSRKSRKTRKQSPWMKHVMETKRANKGKDLSEVLVIASKTYKKGGSEDGMPPTKGGKTRKGRSRKH